MSAIKTFGPVDQRSLEQLKRCMDAGDAEFGVLCADHHPGYSQPIGGGVAYEGYVSPSGVGYDIGCGNKAVLTDLGRDSLDELGGVYQKHFGRHYPAIAWFQVAALFDPDALVELVCVAVIPTEDV